MKDSSSMLISKEKNLYKQVDTDKTTKGRFFTRKAVWLTHNVRDFINNVLTESTCFVDPFAGEGHLLNICKTEFNKDVIGLDIVGDAWIKNDSLIKVPKFEKSIVITNPPYLAKYSAKRKGVYEKVSHYYENFDYDDLYQIALHNSIESAAYVVAIIPETFLNSSFPKENLFLVCVLEDNPFDDTQNPVCIACFDKRIKDGGVSARLYVGEKYCGSYGDIFRSRQSTSRNNSIVFNDANGNVALRAVDSTDPKQRIKFEIADNFKYGREKIKVSSRLLTYIKVKDMPDNDLMRLIDAANKILDDIRHNTHDLILSPFKGNNKVGQRRRRLDYGLARWVLFEALIKLKGRPSEFIF